MSSQLKIQTARQNGAKARDSKTSEGIARSSANAITHGLTSRKIVLATESEEEFLRLRQTYLLQFAPGNPVEADIVDQLIAARWRLERLWNIETSLLDLELVRQKAGIEEEFELIDDDTRMALAFDSLARNSGTLALLNRYEARLQRTYNRALESLRALREMQKLQNDPKPSNTAEQCAATQALPKRSASTSRNPGDTSRDFEPCSSSPRIQVCLPDASNGWPKNPGDNSGVVPFHDPRLGGVDTLASGPKDERP